MRALPVPRDTIDLLVTAAFISSPDSAHAKLLPWPGARKPLGIVADGRDPQRVLAGADHMGQLLWDENHASVSYAERCTVTAPAYEWHPVAELLGTHVDVEQILQIERSRLYVIENSCHHPDWDDSAADRFLQRLGKAIEARLVDQPRVLSPEIAGVIEYEGLSRAVDEWDRSVGFRAPLAAGDVQRQSEGRL
jgi:plasmid stabilization system protein ParE